ncbi:MAG: hypothetical protein WCB98_00365 [Candidatus Aquirickettsiella gammari]
MIIIRPTGIETELLCPASKRYLSRLLVGTTGINPDFIAWKQLLKRATKLYPFLFNPFPEGETLSSLNEKIKIWNQLLTDARLKSYILENLDQHEKEHHISKFKKKSIVLLVVLIISVAIFCSLSLLIPGIMSIILASAFTLASIFFTCSVSLLDFYPTILLKTEQCNQKTEVSQELGIAATLTEPENKIIRISSRPDQKKVLSKHTGKNHAFNNRPNTPTHFFHFTDKKIPQRELNCGETSALDRVTSNLNQNLCVVLARSN